MNLAVKIGVQGTALTNYTDRLVESNDIVLTLECERSAFERVVSDVHLELTNQDAYFNTIFGNAVAQTIWAVEIWVNGRILFYGTIRQPIVFNEVRETVEFDALSIEKQFWEWARASKVFKPEGDPYEITSRYYVTVDYVLIRIIDVPGGLTENSIITGIQTDALYSNRLIRGWADGHKRSTRADNHGRFKELDPNTTVYQLLDAMAKYYNAKFFIDPLTRKLRMVKRGSILNDLDTDITGKIMDEREIQINVLDVEKYDYILTVMKVPKPNAPAVKGAQAATTGRGIIGYYTWLVTSVYEVGGLQIESEPGDATQPLLVNGVLSGGVLYNAKVSLAVPVGPSGTTKRKIYRQSWSNVRDNKVVDPYPVGQYYYVATINNNTPDAGQTTTVFYDDYPAGTTYLQTTGFDGNVWFGFNETTGLWLDPIVNNGSNQAPAGRVLDVTPNLRFVNINLRSQVKDLNINDVISFFGGREDFNIGNFQEQWRDLFISRKRMIASFKDTEYALDDSVTLQTGFQAAPQIGGNKLRIDRATIYIMSEYAELNLVTA